MALPESTMLTIQVPIQAPLMMHTAITLGALLARILQLMERQLSPLRIFLMGP